MLIEVNNRYFIYKYIFKIWNPYEGDSSIDTENKISKIKIMDELCEANRRPSVQQSIMLPTFPSA